MTNIIVYIYVYHVIASFISHDVPISNGWIFHWRVISQVIFSVDFTWQWTIDNPNWLSTKHRYAKPTMCRSCSLETGDPGDPGEKKTIFMSIYWMIFQKHPNIISKWLRVCICICVCGTMYIYISTYTYIYMLYLNLYIYYTLYIYYILYYIYLYHIYTYIYYIIYIIIYIYILLYIYLYVHICLPPPTCSMVNSTILFFNRCAWWDLGPSCAAWSWNALNPCKLPWVYGWYNW